MPKRKTRSDKGKRKSKRYTKHSNYIGRKSSAIGIIAGLGAIALAMSPGGGTPPPEPPPPEPPPPEPPPPGTDKAPIVINGVTLYYLTVSVRCFYEGTAPNGFWIYKGQSGVFNGYQIGRVIGGYLSQYANYKPFVDLADLGSWMSQGFADISTDPYYMSDTPGYGSY